jgi:DNA-binding protein HU-beta
MNKRELVERVCADLGTTKSAAEDIVDKVLAAIQQGVERDGEVVLTGFGSWHRRERAPRTGRHPQTGEVISIPAGQSLVFRPARAWRDSLGGEMEAGA